MYPPVLFKVSCNVVDVELVMLTDLVYVLVLVMATIADCVSCGLGLVNGVVAALNDVR